MSIYLLETIEKYLKSGVKQIAPTPTTPVAKLLLLLSLLSTVIIVIVIAIISELSFAHTKHNTPNHLHKNRAEAGRGRGG